MIEKRRVKKNLEVAQPCGTDALPASRLQWGWSRASWGMSSYTVRGMEVSATHPRGPQCSHRAVW